MNVMKILEAQNLSKRYREFELKDIDLSIEEKEVVGFIGKNGSGKSTAMKILAGILNEDGGRILFEGVDIVASNRNIFKENIGYIGEYPDFFGKESLKNITNFYKDFYKRWNDRSYKDMIRRFNLNEKSFMSELSKGMKVKYALCLVLAHSPKLLILDEITSGLDIAVRAEVLEMLREYVDGTSSGILFSSHISEDMDKLADRLIFLNNGKIVYRCSADEPERENLSFNELINRSV